MLPNRFVKGEFYYIYLILTELHVAGVWARAARVERRVQRVRQPHKELSAVLLTLLHALISGHDTGARQFARRLAQGVVRNDPAEGKNKTVAASNYLLVNLILL